MDDRSNLPVADARRLVRGLTRPNPVIYWADFLISITVAYGALTVYLTAPLFSALQVATFSLTAFAMYRISLFMHELVHFKKGEMTVFQVCWNIIAGIPMLTPSFFYESHIAHHNTHHYGTRNDGEYLPLGNGALRDLVAYAAQVVLQPIVVTVRFLLTPISFLHPKLRQWTLERASSFVINFSYRKPISTNAPRRAWAAMELACSLRAWVIFIAPIVGLTTWSRVPQLYALAVAILTLNHLRALSSHRFLSDGDRMSHSNQFSDSTIITGNLFTSLICPLGQRYHALHHLIPSLPYHNLAEAHRRLSSELPADSPYHKAVYPSYFAVLREMRTHYLTHQSEADQIKRRWYETDLQSDTITMPSPREQPENLSASA